MEKIYIGTKIVAAEPMDEITFFKLRLNPKESEVSTTNRLVWPADKPNREGYKVRYEDGYISWSPKDVFDRSHREVILKEVEMMANGQFVVPGTSGSTFKVA
jgi:hypothetical protein